MERIEGKVAQILNARELVINRGEQHGVRAGMQFAVLNRHGADILDPETGEQLGSVEIEKAVVKIVRTQDRLSVARTFRTFRTSGMPSVAALFAPQQTRYETLKTDERTYKEELTEEESYVKVGDPVVQMVGEEFENSV